MKTVSWQAPQEHKPPTPQQTLYSIPKPHPQIPTPNPPPPRVDTKLLRPPLTYQLPPPPSPLPPKNLTTPSFISPQLIMPTYIPSRKPQPQRPET